MNPRIKQILVLVIIPILIGVVLLLLEHKVIAPSGATTVPTNTLAPKANTNTENFEPQLLTPASEVSPPQAGQAVAASASPDAGLEAQVALVDRLYGVDPRNAAYVKIIDRAIEKNDIKLATAIAEKLYGVDVRNNNYDKIIAYAISAGNWSLADEITNRLYGVDRRNAAIFRVLEARAAKK